MAKKIDYASMFTLRKDGRYQGSYTDDKGRHYVYDRDPEQLYEKLQQRQQPKGPTIPTFKELAEQWERRHREEITSRTWNNYKPHFDAIIKKHGKKPIDAVDALDIIQHLSEAKSKNYSVTVTNSIRSLYRMIFDYAIAEGYVKFNPVTSIKLPKGLKKRKRTGPTKEQMNIILTSLDKPFGLFAYFLLCTGLRKSEALALSWDDIDIGNKVIHITKSLDYTDTVHPKLKPPKTDAGIRDVPILDILLKPIESTYRTSNCEIVFPSPPSNRGGKGGGYMSLRAYEGAWQRYCEAVDFIDNNGKPTLTAHNLRHGTATLMFELGVDELTTQKILGHSRIEITREIYTDLRNEQRERSVKKLNRGMNKMMSKMMSSVSK